MTPVHGFIPQEPLPDYFAPKPPTTGALYFIPPQEPLQPLAPLIGLGGKLRAGKDAVGDYLEEHHGYTKLGMSDALNEALLALNPYIRLYPDTVEFRDPMTGATWGAGEHIRYQDLHRSLGYVEAKKNPEVRRLLQALGTEVGREMIDQDVWVRIAERKINELRALGKPVVITAVRFPNEVEMIRRLGGTTVWIERPERGAEGRTAEIEAHASETSVDASMFQTRIHNIGTLNQLYQGVELVLENTYPSWSESDALVALSKLGGGHVLPKTFGGHRIEL